MRVTFFTEVLLSKSKPIGKYIFPYALNFQVRGSPHLHPNLTEADIFNSLGIKEEEYYNALSISPDSGYNLHLKRPLDSCFINNYFVAGIKGWLPNIWTFIWSLTTVNA